MKKWTKKGKKRLIAGTALVLTAAIGVGIWFGARGSGDPVGVYPFYDIGMTEFWGDNQESYGPVSTDKIQTVMLSDTQTVTKILVKEGQEVKKGDALMTFDTTLTELELERKRLAVEKQKLDLKSAQRELDRIRGLKPMDPDAMNPGLPEETLPDPGREINGDYEISELIGNDGLYYHGATVDRPMILWLKDGKQISNAILKKLSETSKKYREDAPTEPTAPSDPTDPTDATAPSTASNASAMPEDPVVVSSVADEDPENVSPPENPEQSGENTPDGETPNSGMTDGTSGGTTDGGTTGGNTTGDTSGNGSAGNPPAPPAQQEQRPQEEPALYDQIAVDPPADLLTSVMIPLYVGSEADKRADIKVGANGGQIPSTMEIGGKTHWFLSAKRVKDDASLTTTEIPPLPQDAPGQAAWQELWRQGVRVTYDREVSFGIQRLENGELTDLKDGNLSVYTGEDVTLVITADIKNPPAGISCSMSVEPVDGVFKASPNGQSLVLTGKPTQKTEQPQTYTVKALYSFKNNKGENCDVAETFTITLEVKDPQEQEQNDFYFILKITEKNCQRAMPLVWQGVHVYVYDDGSFAFNLFDAFALEDHTLEILEEPELPELPDIDFGSGMTAAQLKKAKAEQERRVKEQDLALRMAEVEYNIMQAEVNDGKVYAQFDGKVVSLLSEEEARQEKKPLMKVSAGGGFYIEVSVSELERENMRIGMEVSVNDWESDQIYTGKVESIGDFPIQGDGWNGIGNPNASYYPFVVFVDGEADLQAGRYASVSYATGTGESGIYLENPFLRTEDGQSYVYVRGENGKLEKRTVIVGKSLWGSYTEILSGLTEEDYIAFPYGKNIKSGAATVEGQLQDLYQ